MSMKLDVVVFGFFKATVNDRTVIIVQKISRILIFVITSPSETVFRLAFC